MLMPNSRETFRFADFELDVAAYELRRGGRPIRLERQPMDVLMLLVERRGALVSHAEIADRLWGKDVFVDVETGIHTAVRKIRQALRDSRERPVFVETVSGKGYRFVAAVEVVPTSVRSAAPATAGEPGHADSGEVATGRSATPSGELKRAGESTPPPVPLASNAPGTVLVASSNRMRVVAGVFSVVVLTGLFAWTRLGGGSTGSRINLAVLPFDNLTGDPEREYVVGGLTEETSASLAQIDQLRLSVKGHTLRYKGTTKTVGEIGQELGVDYLVEGALGGEAGRLRLIAKLIRVRDQEVVWTQSFEREPTSLLGLQQELSTAIAEQIRLRLSSDRLTSRQTRNAAAYDLYLKARHLENRRTPETTARAIQHYERAIALDPDYALAWSGLAFTYAASAMNSDARPHAVWPKAREAAAQAIRANPELAEAHFVTGYVNWLLDWDWQAAEAELRRAIALDPSNAAAHRILGHALSQQGRQGEAQVSMRRARELEPFAPLTHALSAQVAYQARDFAAAVEHARRAIAVDSQLWIGYIELGQVYAQTGDNERALEAFADAGSLSGNNSKALSFTGHLLAKMGRIGEAREVLRTLETISRERYVPPYAMAFVHAGLGERDAAFERLDQAYDERDVHLIFLPVDPNWDAFRADPRFQALLVRCRFTAGS
jgi:TolB-like protein/DNA-binding winged helix-turn-helix (wHTH) protein/Tfp pilus assembly protein PilF